MAHFLSCFAANYLKNLGGVSYGIRGFDNESPD